MLWCYGSGREKEGVFLMRLICCTNPSPNCCAAKLYLLHFFQKQTYKIQAESIILSPQLKIFLRFVCELYSSCDMLIDLKSLSERRDQPETMKGHVS